MQDGATATPAAASKGNELVACLKEVENRTKSLEHQILALLEKINGPLPMAEAEKAMEEKATQDFFSQTKSSADFIFRSLTTSDDLMKTLNALFGV